MALDILSIDISQMQRLTLTFLPPSNWEEATIEAEAYPSDLSSATIFSIVNLREVEIDGTTYLQGRTDARLPLGWTGDIMIVADAEVGTEFPYTAELDRNLEDTLYQAVYDAITTDDMQDSYGRAVKVLDNGLFVPEDVTDGESVSVATPFAAVGRPVITETTVTGLNLATHVHELAIKISDDQDDSEVSNVTHLHGIARTIMQRLIQSSDLGLHQLGIEKNCMDYQIENTDNISDGDSLNTVTLTLEVTQHLSV